jgi:hypothetical protein
LQVNHDVRLVICWQNNHNLRLIILWQIYCYVRLIIWWQNNHNLRLIILWQIYCYVRLIILWQIYCYVSRGFKVFYNRRYFLNFRRYLKNFGLGSGARLRAVRGPGFFAPQKLLKSSILWTKKCTSETAKHFVSKQSVFERKIPLTFSLEFRFHQDHA